MERMRLMPDQRQATIEKIQELTPKIGLVKACQEVGVKYQTYYGWVMRKRRGVAKEARVITPVKGVDEVKLTKAENVRLREIVVNQMLDIQALKEYCGRV